MTSRSHVSHTSWHSDSVSACLGSDTPGIVVVMYVVKVPNRGSPPAILLRESYREAGKVKNRTLANLSAWPEAKVDALTRVLKGQPPPAAFQRASRPEQPRLPLSFFAEDVSTVLCGFLACRGV